MAKSETEYRKPTLDIEVKPNVEPTVEKPIVKEKPIVEKPKAVKEVVSHKKTLAGYKITKRDGKVVKSEPIYS